MIISRVQKGHFLKRQSQRLEHPVTVRCLGANVPPPLQRLEALQSKIVELRKTLKTVKCEVEREEIYVEISKAQRAIQDIRDDPLSNDFCIDEPWADECRVYE